MQWTASWTQAMSNLDGFRGPLDDVTLRSEIAASTGGTQVRLELSNRYGADPVTIGRGSMTVAGQARSVTVGGSAPFEIPAGGPVWTDPVALLVGHGEVIRIDLHLPSRFTFATSNFVGAACQISTQGDFVGARHFPAAAGTDVPLPNGASLPPTLPFVRAVDVAGSAVRDVVVCFGDSITAAGWPQTAAGLLPAEEATAVVSRGIAGNRLRFDGGPANEGFGASGLARFEHDVLGTAGATEVVIALGTNDLGHPGAVAPLDELPSADDLIEAYQELTLRAQAAGLRVTVATITPFLPAAGYDEGRERIRGAVNQWIRTSAPAFIDFDDALRDAADPARLADRYDSGDHLHPNEAGTARLAELVVDSLRCGRTTP